MDAKTRRERLKQRQQQAVKDRGSKGSGKGVIDLSEYEDVKWYEPTVKREKNLVDFIPFRITQEWYPKLLSRSGNPIGLEVGDIDYKLEIPVHKRVGVSKRMFLCLAKAFGKKCFLCEEWEAAKADENISKEAADELKPKWQVYYNLIDCKNDEGPVLLFSAPHYFFESKMLEEAEVSEEEVIYFSDLEDGKSVQFKGKEEKFSGNKYLNYDSFDFVDRAPYGDDVIDEAYPLDKMLIISTYEEQQRCHLEMDEEEGSTATEKAEKEEASAPSGRKRNRPKTTHAVDEEKDDVPPDEQTEEAEPEPKKEETPEPEPEKEKTEEATTSANGDCPKGHTYGKDCDEYPDDCADCDEWNNCADAQEAMNKEKEEEKEAEKEKPTRKRTRGAKSKA